MCLKACGVSLWLKMKSGSQTEGKIRGQFKQKLLTGSENDFSVHKAWRRNCTVISEATSTVAVPYSWVALEE